MVRRARTVIAASKQLKVRPPAARLDETILLIGFARVFPLAGRKKIHLTPTGSFSAGVLSAYTKQDQLHSRRVLQSDSR